MTTRRFLTLVAALAVVALLIPCAAAMAQEQKVTSVQEGEVLRVANNGHTVIIRNFTTGEIKMFTEIPANAVIYVEGKPAKITDLRQGMKLKAVRFESVPAPVTITESELAAMPVEETPAPAPAPAPAPEPAAAAPVPAPAAQLPATASSLPLAGLAGLGLLLVGFVAGGLRRRMG